MAQKNPKNKGQHNNPFEVDGGEEPNEKAGATRPSTPFIVIGVGIATLFAIGGVVVGAIYIAKRHNREVQEVSQPKLPNTVPEVPDEIPDPLIAISKSDDAGSPLSGEEVFKRLMKSTAFIVPIHENKDFRELR